MRRIATAVFATLLALFASSSAVAVTFDWVGVPGTGTPNACDLQPQGCFGSVADDFLIAKYEVTNAQYAEFLNAVARTDYNELYSSSMNTAAGGIKRMGSWGSYSYTAKSGFEQRPVNFVSFYDALRFANWLHNGQPTTGHQTDSTTEDGAYEITADGIADNSITRKEDATIFLPSEDQWYKAAYFDGTSWLDYPSKAGASMTCATPGPDPDTANCGGVVGGLTDVGSYTRSPGPHSTFDQAGNVWEWNEAILTGSVRGLRGGNPSANAELGITAAGQGGGGGTSQWNDVGFRVAMIPEPGTSLLLGFGLLGLGVGRKRQSR